MSKPYFLSHPSVPMSGNRYSTMDYESVDSVEFEDCSRTLSIFNNFTIDRDLKKESESGYRAVYQSSANAQTLEIEDDVVLISIFNGLWGYFHLIYNIIGEVEFIKQHYPDVKIKIIKFLDQNDFFTTKLLEMGLKKAYGILDEDIIDLAAYKNIKIKKVFSLFSEYNHALKYLYRLGFNYDMNGNELNGWGKAIKKSMQERFGIVENNKPLKKIFISRLKDNERLREESDIIYKKLHGYPLDITETQKIAKLIKKDYFLDEADRPMVRSEEKELEKLFEQAGYEVVDPGKLSTIQEQAELYNSASHIVGLSGAGFINCIFAQPNAKILILNSSTTYIFPHEAIVRSFGLDVAEAPRITPWKKRRYFAQGIFKYVQQFHPDFLD